MNFDWEAHREKLVEEHIEHLMSEGQKYYPFSVTNFTEAIQNLDDAQYLRVAIYAEAFEGSHDNPYTTRLYAVCMNSVAREYWRNIAYEEADKDTESAEEMRLNAKDAVKDGRGF